MYVCMYVYVYVGNARRDSTEVESQYASSLTGSDDQVLGAALLAAAVIHRDSCDHGTDYGRRVPCPRHYHYHHHHQQQQQCKHY